MPQSSRNTTSTQDLINNSLTTTELNAVGSSIAVTGDLITSDRLIMPDGSNTIPSLTFTSDEDTGLYRASNNTWAFTSGGTLNMSGNATSVSSQVTHLIQDGTVGTPGLTFASDPDTGFYRTTANEFNIACAGALVGKFTSTNFTYGTAEFGQTVQTYIPNMQDDSTNQPTYSNQTGHYHVIGNAVFFTININWSTKASVTAGEGVRISLPLAPSSNAFRSCFTVGSTNGINTVTASDYITSVCQGTQQYADLFRSYTTGGASMKILWSDLSASGYVQLSGMYFVN